MSQKAEMVRVDVSRFKQAARQHDNKNGTLNLAPVKFGPTEIVKDDVSDTEPRTLTWVISTAAVDRDNDTIDPNGWQLNDFIKGGSVLWAHDRKAPPVAKPLATWVEDGQLKSRAQFTDQDENPFGYMTFKLAKGGYVRSSSVGFLPIQWRYNQERGEYAVDFLKQILLEWSVLAVPSNPEALLEARSKGIDLAPMVSWAEMALDGDSGLLLPRETLEAVHKAAADPVVVVPVASSDKSDTNDTDDTVVPSGPESGECGDGDVAAKGSGSEQSEPDDETTKRLAAIEQRLSDLEASRDAVEEIVCGATDDDAVQAALDDDDGVLLEIEDADDAAKDAGEELGLDDVRDALRDTLGSMVKEKVDDLVRRRQGRLD
ncbi:MAG: hypothetical protein AMJ46_12585 [Latescibacteria bacterium DG_63]|nr:MAG: hypothetical protein AMJ46_12585 [Latescibacteria bacterium DG_63]